MTYNAIYFRYFSGLPPAVSVERGHFLLIHKPRSASSFGLRVRRSDTIILKTQVSEMELLGDAMAT